MFFPADYEEWDDAVTSIYPIKKFQIEKNNLKIKLFSPDKKPYFFTNAPYVEEGGIFLSNGLASTYLKEEIEILIDKYDLKYVLLKSREKIIYDCLPENNIDGGYCTFLLDTTESKESIWENRLKAKTRNQIRKGEKNKFQIRFGQEDLLKEFYEVISLCWRDLGTPVHDYHFFRLLLEKFSEKALITVLFDKGKPISSAFLFNINGVVSHPFAGTINPYKPTSANNVLYWNIIKFACDSDINIFDMGRSRLNQGTYNFKKSWGGEVKNIYHYYFLNKKQEMPSYDTAFYKVATSLWKFMPLSMANILGPKLIYKIL